jgi:hypothetical protein
MDPAWKLALTDFALLFLTSAFASFGSILLLNKPQTLGGILGATIRNGAIGAVAGVSLVETIGQRKALALAAGVGAGIISERAVWGAVLRACGIPSKADPNDEKT